MQRKIKFRGKEIDTGKWVYGGLFKEPAPPQCFEKNLEDKYWIVYPDPRYMPDWNLPYEMVRTDVEKETIGQYTGLKDKNGKEIYEGDIVYIAAEDERGIIRWDNETARYVVIYDNIITDFDNWYGEDLEVIGNIYDNKDLLEKGE